MQVDPRDVRPVRRGRRASARSSISARRTTTRRGARRTIYRGLFEHVAGLLPDKGRFYLQTMVFGRNMIPVEQVDRHAPRESDAWYLAMMKAAFPGSFLPFGQEQVVRCAAPHFRLVSSQSGRLDYIETIRQWDKRTEAWNPRMALLKLRLLPKWLTSSDFRFAFTSGRVLTARASSAS